jgi:glycosyltransferase involved in cell wall biosynthesis
VKLSVIVPTHNRRELLVQTLPKLFGQDFPSDEWELVIVDDGSTDGTGEFLKRLSPPCAMRIVEQSNRGPAGARNAALKVARGDLVLFLDDDLLCEPQLLRKHAAAHNGGDARVVFGPVLIAQSSTGGLASDYLEHWYERYVERFRTNGTAKSPYEVW